MATGAYKSRGRTVASGSGTLATLATTTVAITRQTGEVLSVYAAGFVSGTTLVIGPGGDLDVHLENPGTTTTGYNLVISNNSAVTIAYEYAVVGVTP